MNKKITTLLTILFLTTTSLWSQDYDYKWFSSDSAGGPTYNWVDITSTGTQIQMTGDDNNTGPFNIGFSFPYYGNEYTTFRICTNGWVSFTNTSTQYSNTNLPGSSAPENLLAPFWDDLSFYSTNRAYYHYDGSRLVITFNDVPRLGSEFNSSFTFQIIIYPSGEIIYQYQTMTYTSSMTESTIGWQDDTRAQGTAIVFNTTNYNIIQDNLAISIEDVLAGVRPPSGFTATPSYQTATLSWTASSTDTVSSYVLSRGLSSSTLALYDSVASTVTSYIDSNLTNGTTYYYGAKSKSQNGVYSSRTTANTTPRVDAPDSLTTTAGNAQVALSWVAASGNGVVRTLIYQGTSSSNLSLVDSTNDGTTTTKTITALTNGTSYYFALRARGQDNSVSLESDQASATPQYVGPVWWVATNGSSANDGSESLPFSTITSAISAASDGDTVKIKSGTFSGTGNRGVNPGSKNVVIISSENDPDSTILDAGNIDRHFYLSSNLDSTFKLIGLTLKNGSESNGGSIYISNTSPRIINCVFKNNVSTSNGGAVYIEGYSEVTEPIFTNCTFRDNQTRTNGGAIYMSGESAGNQSIPRFVSCTIISNDVISDADDYANGSGGGFYSGGEMRPVFIDCQIDSNTVVPGRYDGQGGGGYIYGYSGGATSNFTRCTFRGNSVVPPYSNAQGGALYVSNGEVELTNCLISGNSVVGGESNTDSYYGQAGGIYIQQHVNYNNGSYEASESKIINCTIVNNSASSVSNNYDYPGGVKFEGTNATVTMFNTIIWGNTSDENDYNSIEYYSWGVTLAADYNNIEGGSSESWFNPNSFDVDPLFSDATTGDYSLSNASPVIGGGASTYEGYSAPINDITGATRPNPSSSSPDLGAYENSLSATPYPDQVADVTATSADQSVVLSWTANSESDIASYKVYKDTTSGFTPSSSTLAATVTHPTVTATVTGLTNKKAYYFRISAVDNDSYEGSYSAEASATPEYSGPVWWVATSDSGGASNNEGSQNSPYSSLQTAITAASTGDTVKVKKGTYSGSSNRGLNTNGKNLVIMSVDGADSTFLNAGNVNRHFSFNNSEDTTFQVIGFTLQNGKKTNDSGGSVYINNASPKFKNCIFKDNEVTNYGSAGAVYIYNGSPIFNNCTFRDNSSEYNGGAISIQEDDSAPVFNNCTITSNSASNDAGDNIDCKGGGIYVSSGAPTFNDCIISYNTVSSGDYSGEGGGVCIGYFNNLDYDPVTFNRCKIIGNSSIPAVSTTQGGGIKISSKTVLSSCLIADNTATAGVDNNSEGGGIYIYNSNYYNSTTQSYETGEVVIVNCTITGNAATVSTSSNNGNGGGMYVGWSQDVRMFNTIIWDNTSSYKPNLYNDSNAGLTADYNDIQNGTGEYYFGENSLDEDPKFTDAVAGDYTLAISSNLIGAGASTYESYSAPAKDIAGNDRPGSGGGNPDLGAYENSYATSPYPAPPSNLSASAGNAQITLHWDVHSETDVTSYGIYYGTTANPTVKQLDVNGRTTDSTVVTGLSNNIAYYFRITAIDGDNYESGFSNEFSETPVYSGTTIFVDGSLSSYPNPDGSSGDPFETIQDAIDAEATTSGKRVLVKAGTYTGSGSSSYPVINLKGKNLIMEAESGPGSTTIDGEGSRTTLELNSDNNEYSGYNSSTTKFIGFTFTNGDDDKPLIIIDGPDAQNSSNSWDVTFENCRFTSTDNDYGNNESIIVIKQSNTVFDGCTFRELNINNSNNSGSFYAPIKLTGGTNWYDVGGIWSQDTTVYRPQFKNCIIADNSLKSTTNGGNGYYGGAVYVGYGAIPYFENTRIDSNEVDPGSGPDSYNWSESQGGGVYIVGMYNNGPPIKFVNCSISHNILKGASIVRGGGVSTGYGQTQFINCLIARNDAVGAYSNLNNYTGVYGGGIHFDFPFSPQENTNYPSIDPQLLIVNSTIADNVITPYSLNNDNSGAGISRDGNDDPILMFNSIVYNNTVTGGSYYSNMNMSTMSSPFGDSETLIGYSIIQYADDAGINGDEILDTDPSFTGNNDYSLSTASAAIGAGIDVYEEVTAPVYDYSNNVRPSPAGSNPDIGAFENSLSTTPYPNKPQSLTVSSTGDSTVTLNWTANSENDLAKYRIYRGTSSPATTLADSASATATSKTVPGLSNDTEYHFRITAVDQDGYESDFSNEVSGTPQYKGPVWYVDTDAAGTKDGSPTHPFHEIQVAVDSAGIGDTVLVLPGTYDRGGDQYIQFKYTDSNNQDQPKNIVLKSRDGAATTILDGEGSKRLFEIVDKTDTTLQIIGFTITNGGENDGMGGVIKIEGQQTWDSNTNQYVNTPSGATFKECVISENHILDGSAPIKIERANAKFIDCEIADNSNTHNSNEAYGGALLINFDSRVEFERCIIKNNMAISPSSHSYGGFLASREGSSIIIIENSVIAKNISQTSGFGYAGQGGALYIRGGSCNVINSTIVENESINTVEDFRVYGGGICLENWTSEVIKVNIFNSIVYGNLPNADQIWFDQGADIDHYISYSIINGSDPNNFEDGVLDIDPEFADTTYILHDRSPAIGAGETESEDVDGNVIYPPTSDLAGNVRPNPAGSNPDLGAYEHELAISPYPAPPSNLMAVEKHQAVDLSWTAPFDNDVVKYYVYQADSTDSGWSSWVVVDTLHNLSSTSTTITDLTNGLLYSFYVTSIDTLDYESFPSLQVKTTPYFQGPIWYVDGNQTSGFGKDGSPALPFREIKDAIDAIDPLSRTDGLKDTILVLPGTYDRTDDKELYFKYNDGINQGQPKNIVLKSRDGAETTILNGEGNRVFEIVDGTDTTLQIIGFTITASTGGENDGDGSVIKIHGQTDWQGNQEVVSYSSATFKNCVIKDVDGEDTPIELHYGKAIFIDCEISGNTFDATNYGTDAFGGAITVGSYNQNGQMGTGIAHFYNSKLVNNTITTSQSGYIHGGAIAVGGSIDNELKLVNTIVAGNHVWFNNSDSSYPPTGGGIKFRGGKIYLFNSTIADNQISTNGSWTEGGSAIIGEDWNQDSNSPQLTIFNSIIFGNTIVTNASSSPTTSHTDQVKFSDWNDGVDVYASYSLIGGNDDLGGDEILLNIDPDFADTTYVLHDRSPAIGAGASESEDVDGNVIYPPSNDLARNVRPNPYGSNPDLGAYEHELAVTPYPAAVQNMTAKPLHRSVLLEWDFHIEEDVVSYVAYMSDDSITFSAVDTVSGRFSTRTTIDSLTNTVPYWFYVTAVDTADYESAASLQSKTSPFYQGPVWIVTAQNSSSSGEGSPEDPMKNIRDAIESAADGDTIMLMPGTYNYSRNRNLDFQYNNDIWQNGVKNLTLMSEYGPDTTIIDLSGNDFIDLISGETDSRIEGLTITNSSSGAVYIQNSSLDINNCIFENNSENSFNGGGAIYLEGTNQPIEVSNTLFKGNTVNDRGGAIAFGTDGSEMIIVNSIFDNNSANETGGAINKDHNTNLTIVNSLFLNNQIQQNWGAAGVNIMTDNGSVDIVNSIFLGNVLSDGTDGDIDGTAYVDHCILQSVNSPAFNSGENFVFTDVEILNDTANSDYSLDEFSPAIGLGLDEFYDNISQSDFFINQIETDFLGNARVQPADSRIDLGPIEHARWEQRRQVFYLATDGDDSNDGLTTSTPFASLSEAFNKSVIRDTIELASGTYAGANNRDLNFGGVDRIIRSTDGAETTIIDCENQGQAFIFENGETDSTIISGITIQNGVSDYGGAVDIDGADPIFDGVIFMDNSASTSGGAVYASNSNAEFVNCVFVGNHAAESGIMNASGGAVAVDFATAVGNKGDDDMSINGDVTITNSIFWGNSDIDDGISVTYSDVQGGAPGGNLGTGNYNGRPGFTDGQNGDFHLQDWSPVIGQASATTGVLYDLEGNARSDSIPDMGAYENALDAASTYTKHNWYVSTTGSDSVRSGMGTVQDPFGSIQFAMNHGIYDDEIHIAPGAYSESLNNWGKDLLIVGGAVPSDVAIDGYFEISGGSPALYDLHLTNVNGTSDALQINNDAVVTMYNLLITNSNYAGVTVNNDAIATMYNLTIYGNTTGIYENSTGTVSAVNSILWNNTAATYGAPTITYSDVEGSYTGTGNINDDPNFVDVANGDFNLQITSPCIDAGDPTDTYDSDSTVIDMGAFPLIREFLAGTSTGNVDVTNDESAVITQDFTIVAGDTMTVEPGATVYFDPGVTMTVDGVLGASGVAGNPVSFASTDPDSTYGGVIINSGSGGGRDLNDSFYYMVIQDVGAAFIPLTINGDATIEHVTIAGNDNSTSLEVNSGTVDLNYSILEGSTSGSGTINETGSFTVSTDQFVSYSTNDFTLLSSAAAIDVDTTENWIDPDYTYADAGCFYHDQTGYISSSVVVLYPVFGDTISVSPDTSSAVGSGLSVEVQVFNSIGHYMTNPSILWGNAGQQFGTYAVDNTIGASLSGKVSNTYFTTTITNDLNSLTVDENGATAQGGYFKIVPGSPDSVWVNEQTDMTMTQLSSLVFEANIFDQFANLVADNETVAWDIVPVVGNGDGFTLDNSTASTQGGIVNVNLNTDPTGNSLAVGDQVKVSATSGSGTHESGVVTIIPDDIYNLEMPSELTDAQIDLSADVATIEIEATMIDTFDNPLEGVEVNWEVVTGNGTGENLSSTSSFTDVNGVANVTLNTSTVSESDYTVHGWVTDDALFAVIMGTSRGGQNSVSDSGIMLNQKSGNTKADLMNIRGANTLISLPVRVVNTTNETTSNRDDRSVYDLNDTTAVIHVVPGVTNLVSLPPDSVDVLLGDQFQIVGFAYDQFGNVVAEGTPVVWEIVPANNYVTIVNSNANITGGQATCDIQIEMNAPWDFDFVVNLTSEGITGSTGTHNIDDVTSPDPISDLAIIPDVWTSTNDFTLSWSNPYDHAGVFGAHVSIDGNGDGFTEEQNITSLSGLTLPSNALSTFDVWLEDNAGNDDSGNAVSIVAKWDDTNPNAFTVTYPLDGWYNQQFLDFEWNASSDATAGLKYYEVTINSTNNYQQHPDSTQISIPDGFAEGAHQWTMTVYDSAGNATETSNPQTINIDFTDPVISHNPVLEGSDNSPASISASFDDPMSGIDIAELYYRKGGESQWQAPVDMKTLNTYVIASSFVTSVGVEYYIYSRDVAGNETYKPAEGHYSISVTIPGVGLSSTDRWPTGIPNGSAVSSYQFISFPGQAANATPTDILVDDLLAYDDTKWRFFTYSGGGWNEFATINTIDPGVGYFLIVKDAGFNITTGQTRSVTTDDDFTINFTSGEWVMLGNPFDFSIPLENVLIDDSTNLAGDPNFYTYDGANGWVSANKLEPWKGYVYKPTTANQLFIKPSKSSSGLKIVNPEIVLQENEWLIDISARNGLGVDKINTVGMLTAANDEYDALDAFEPPMLPGGISLRMDNRDWAQHGDTYTTDIRTVKEEGEFWDMEIAAEDDRHNVYIHFEGLADIPAEFDVFAIDVTLGVAQDLRWKPIYRYAVSNPEAIHDIRFIAGTKEFVNANNAGVELYPDRFSISQNYPNPFNPQTSILITLEDIASVDLIIYNLLGEEVIRISDNQLYPAGYHNFIWKGLNRDGKRVASGVYFYSTRITDMSGKTILNQTKKMIMVK